MSAVANRRPAGRLLGLILAVSSLAAAPAAATTYVRMDDGDLLAQAPVVVEAQILKRLPPIAGAPPRTDVLAVVQRVIKGDVETGALVVRAPGGDTDGGLRLIVEGGVVLAVGETALLFLDPNPDGTFSPLHSALGVFYRDPALDRPIARRVFGRSRLLSLDLRPTTDPARDYELFVAWLADRAAGRSRPADYLLAPGADTKYNLLTVNGRNVRWFEFDSGGSVRWRFRTAGAGNTSGAFRSGLAAWNGAGTPVRLLYGGTTGSTAGFVRPDSTNAIIFGDPNNQVAGTFRCGQGGVVAAGGFWSSGGTASFQGQRYIRILEGDIVVNDGAGCLISNNARTAGEVFAHELGHTLGIGHSGNRDATMFASLHADGRGASLRTDDKNALRRLYGTGGNGGDGGGDPGPPAPAAGPDPPTNLQVSVLSATKLRVRWRDNSRDETAFEVERRIVGRNWGAWRTESANTVVFVATDAKPETSYEFRVRARRGEDVSTWSNTVSAETPAGLDAPRNLRAWAVSPTEVALRWRDTSSSELKFQLWVRPAGGEWRLAETLDADTTRATYPGAQPGATYEFRVRAKRGSRFGDYSRTATVTLPLS